MHLLQFSQSIDSPSEIYVAFQWDPLLWPSLPPPQEGHGDTRVLCQMPSDSLRSTSTSKSHIHRHYRTISIDLIDIPHTKPESPALPALLLAVLVFLFLWSTAIVNLRSKYSEKNRSKEQLGTMKRGKTERKGEKKKHEWRTKKPSWSTFATGSQWSHPVFLWGCVWTKRSLKLGYSTVLRHHYGHY